MYVIAAKDIIEHTQQAVSDNCLNNAPRYKSCVVNATVKPVLVSIKKYNSCIRGDLRKEI